MLIDAHTHLFPPSLIAGRDRLAERDSTFAEMYADPEAAMATVEQLDGALTAGRFDGAGVAGFAFSRQRDIDEQNEYLFDCVRSSRHSLAPFVSLNPALPGWEHGLEGAASAGAVGVGELRPGSQGWDPLGETGNRLCQLAGELGLIMLWHASEPVGHAYPGKAGGIGPPELIRAAMSWPETVMIGAHLGAGATFYLQMPEIINTAKRLYVDTAAAFLLYDTSSIARTLEIAGTDRVLFASDYPLQLPHKHLARVAENIPVEVTSDVLGGTASKLFFERETE